uniref:Putative secreted peptide n=1 Tax=Anopheles braziliensis TaxID=58242 RepID=A0A2M3ZP70_9DIPT
MMPLLFSFFAYRGARYSFGSIALGLMLMAGAWAGFCMLRNDRILATSLSYELSASERPFEANRQAAIHFAYCSSLSHRIHISLLMLCSSGTSSLMLNFFCDRLTSGVTSQPRRLIVTCGALLPLASSRDL